MNNIIIGALWPMLISVYRTSGREAVKRMLTIPEKDIARIQKKNGDELSEGIEKRDDAVEGVLNLVEELANLDDD